MRTPKARKKMDRLFLAIHGCTGLNLPFYSLPVHKIHRKRLTRETVCDKLKEFKNSCCWWFSKGSGNFFEKLGQEQILSWLVDTNMWVSWLCAAGRALKHSRLPVSSVFLTRDFGFLLWLLVLPPSFLDQYPSNHNPCSLHHQHAAFGCPGKPLIAGSTSSSPFPQPPSNECSPWTLVKGKTHRNLRAGLGLLWLLLLNTSFPMSLN